MPAPAPPPAFMRDFEPETGRPVAVAEGVVRVTAPNAGPFTFTGTNSFILGDSRVLLLDPGPDDARHAAALEAALAGRRVEAILLTHTHRDHSALARGLGRRLDAPLWFAGPHRLSRPALKGERNPVDAASDWRLEPDRVLADGETVAGDGIALVTMATPGHCANHIAFGIAGTDLLLTGDHIMGWNSTVISVPDGSMADYLASLDKVLASPYRRYLPAHGGPVAEGPAHAAALKAHRLARNDQVLAAVTGGARSIGAVTRAVYPGLSPLLLPAARMTVKAHVEHLEAAGLVEVRRSAWRLRLLPAAPPDRPR